jgi:predicted phage terminase large subunit-like protein
MTMEAMGRRRREDFAAQLTPRFPSPSGYIPHVPHPPQQAFLLLSHIAEVFYGGAAGGGKSDAVLMAALQYVDVPGYSALIIRRTFQDLALPGAIMNRAEQWLTGTGARKRDGGRLWEFTTSDPSRPATLQFGYAATHADVYRYQGAEFQFVGIDELTQFEERTYRYLFSRLRGPSVPCVHCGHGTSMPAGQRRGHDEGHEGCDCETAEPDRDAVDEAGQPLLPSAADGSTLADVPLRMRAGSNPGGLGHEWVKARFVSAKTKRRGAMFVPARLEDNPSLDRRAYRAALAELTDVERARLEGGDWEATDDGDLFERAWFRIVDEAPADCRWVRYWDLAATVEKPAARKKKDPDWTVGALVGLSPLGQWFVADIKRFRKAPLGVEQEIAQAAQLDGRSVAVRIEQEGGSSGVNTIDHYRRVVLPGWDFDGLRPTLSKEERARPVARAAQAGNVALLSAPWNRALLDELAGFPNLPHDDQVDALSGAMEVLTTRPRARIIA